MSTTTNTIKFNVGGKHFEVSRDLMEAHSETMLGKLVSETWQQDPEEQVFIDRNGDTFAYILDYLRYGSIELPPTIPKSSFERDLDFYGLAPKEGEIMEKCFADEIASSRQDRDNAKKHLDNAQSKYAMHILAVEVYRQYTLKKLRNKKVVEISSNDIRTDGEIGKDRGFLSETENSIFLSSLDKYFGLRMASKANAPRKALAPPIVMVYLHSALTFGHIVISTLSGSREEEPEMN